VTGLDGAVAEDMHVSGVACREPGTKQPDGTIATPQLSDEVDMGLGIPSSVRRIAYKTLRCNDHESLDNRRCGIAEYRTTGTMRN
jgi:hypothetical protein